MKQQTKITLLLATTLFAASAFSYADTTMYKWVDKKGVVSFSQEPPSEAQASEVTTITVQSMPETEQRAAKRMLVNENPNESLQDERLNQADQAVENALKQLEIAEKKLKAGSVPTGEDRIGNVNGRARLRDSYFERVTILQNEVDRARQVLTDSYNARDQISPD